MNSRRLPGLTVLPCVIHGGWTSPDRLLWQATVACEQPIVCLDLLVSEGHAYWSKTPRLQPDADVIRIALGVSATDPGYVTIAGRSIALPARLARPGARPDLPAAIATQTGHLQRLCHFATTPAIEALVVILAASDVRWARNQIWRLRPPLTSQVGEPLASILADGRSGKLDGIVTGPGVA